MMTEGKELTTHTHTCGREREGMNTKHTIQKVRENKGEGTHKAKAQRIQKNICNI